ncbi:hypothetical protein MNBD_IGNAVI01-537, partial [hydrothermal vent metagenome]
RVFNPDPVTALSDNSLTDQGDSDYSALSLAYDEITLNDLNDPIGGYYYMVQGKYAKSMDITFPDVNPISETAPGNFTYNRSENGFEEVNIYYFIDKQRRYVGNLGFSPTWDYVENNSQTIAFDARGRTDRNATYERHNQYLKFGVPSDDVDAGEDVSVILHEYGHALHDALIGGSSGIKYPSTDTWGVTEGIGDYMSISYRRSTQATPYMPNNRSNWFAPDYGESILSIANAKYPGDWGSDKYEKMKVWASTLMDIEYNDATIPSSGTNLGRDITTKLLLTSIQYVTANNDVIDNVHAILQADRDIYDGSHLSVLASVFNQRGFFYNDQVSGTLTTNTIWSGNKYVVGDVTVDANVTLTIADDTFVFLAGGTSLKINGTLNVNGTSSNKVTFDFGSPTNYSGIKFYYGSSGTIDNAIIKNAFYGVYIMNSAPTIKNSEIYDCSYGIQSYYNSPTIETNKIYDITNYGIYAYSGSPTITDNYIHDTGSYGVALNATTDTYIRKNSIKKCDGGVFAWGNQSSIKMIGYTGNYYGLNEIEDYENEHGVLITGGTADLGVYGGSSYKYGYNNIIKNVGSVVKNSTSSMILAEKNYWGGTPVVTWFVGDVSWIKYLSSPYTSSGSSLDLNKTINVEPDKQMLYEASELTDSKSYNLASNMYKQLISEYPDSRYGGLALAWSMTSQKLIKDLETQRDYLQNQTTHKNKRVRNSAILWLQTLEAEAGNKEAADKVVNSTSIKETIGVEIRLNWANDLLNIYNDEKGAEAIFEELTKADASESTLSTIAAIKSTALNIEGTEEVPKSEESNNNVEEIVVSETKLNASYPNPFNPTATISYQLQYKSHVSLIVYNSIGQVVVELVNQQKEKGIYNVDFDASNLSSGLYIYRLQVNTPDGKGNFTQAKKMILLR